MKVPDFMIIFLPFLAWLEFADPESPAALRLRATAKFLGLKFELLLGLLYEASVLAFLPGLMLTYLS